MGHPFNNIKTPENTIDRMVLSVVDPTHDRAYMQSCYGHVCREIRNNPDLQPTDKVVLLGIPNRDGVIHAVLMRDDSFLIDTCSNNAHIEEDIYIAPSTKGAEPTRMQVQDIISLQDFGVKCLNLIGKNYNGAKLARQTLKIS